MVENLSFRSSKIVSLLERLVRPELLEAGMTLVKTNSVIESYVNSGKLQGVVREPSERTVSCSVQLDQDRSLEPLCECVEEPGTWCAHSVALLLSSEELGFLEDDSGFAKREALIRINPNSPRDIAAVLRDLHGTTETATSDTTALIGEDFRPDVTVILLMAGDRLGVQVRFDQVIQLPTLFRSLQKNSARALDNLLIKLLDDEGVWSEESHFWFMNESRSIETILGLLREYKDVRIVFTEQFAIKTAKHLRFADSDLEATVTLSWQDTNVELQMDWRLPDGSAVPKQGDLLGSGPFWTIIESTIYRLSQTATKIAAIFPYSSTISLSKNQAGPVLEALSYSTTEIPFIRIENKELQPASETATPRVIFEIRRIDTMASSVGHTREIGVSISVDFEYPVPPSEMNIVYLPDRAYEQVVVDQLRGLGFQFDTDRRRYIAMGDSALDFLSRDRDSFPTEWTLNGFDEARRNLKFARLGLNVSLGAPQTESEPTERINWFECHIALTLNNAHVPISTLFKQSQQSHDRWIQLDNGAFAAVPGGGLTQLKATLGMVDANFRLTNSIRTKLSTAQALSLGRMGESGSFAVNADKKLQELAARFHNFAGVKKLKASKKFEGKLRPYQEEGLSWMNFLNEFGCGGILADEMGLGKTVQALAFLQHLRDKKSRLPSLVVAPTSLITNWCHEARRFAPELKVLALQGPERKDFLEKLREYDLIVTSYVLLRIDRRFLEKQEYNYVLLDEAQNIKNHEAATTKAAKGLRSQNRLALTGTPTENRPMELWSIMDFLMPGYLGSPEFFKNSIEKPILEQGTGVEVAKLLKLKTRPFILRRTKAEVERDLPPKIESILYTQMEESQLELYSQILQEVRPKVFGAIAEKGVKGASISILAALLRLRQVCNHPNSIGALKGRPGYESGKFNLLKQVVEEALESGKKILLYSQFLDMLGIIKDWLQETGTSHLYLDGSTKSRQELVDKFNSDPSIRVFLISLKAGGTGLNLTGADTVIIYDPWWNPAVENQAADRAHRIGQTKTVNIYRLVTENSVESRIMQLKEKKAKIVDALINENGLSTVQLSKADIEALFAPIQS
jgi:superfamily II DNA or RNA helicase